MKFNLYLLKPHLCEVLLYMDLKYNLKNIKNNLQ
jgi:hypothetical protein